MYNEAATLTKNPPAEAQTRNLLVEQNLGLVHHCAKRFIGRGVEYDDLYSAGCIGLIKAIDNFDDSRGWKLSTYAVPMILGEIKRLFRDGGSVKVSRGLRELSLKVARTGEQFTKDHNRDPSVSELANLIGVSVEAIAEAIAVNTPTLSLTHSDEDGKDGQVDLPVDPPEDALVDRMTVESLLQCLSDQDEKLLRLRYFQRKTQVQTASLLGMTQVQVSRREKKILLYLRGQIE